jgi:hypothetical protein
MTDAISLFLEAAEVGILADSGLLDNSPTVETVAAVIEYERWRAAFEAGHGCLVTASGKVITCESAMKAKIRRLGGLRKAGQRRKRGQ